MKQRKVLAGVGTITLLFLSLFLILVQRATAQQSSLSDRSALLALRSSLGLRARDWPLKADPCTNWTGVSCKSGRVTRITLSGLRRTRVGRQNPRFAVDSLAYLTSLVSFNASGFALPGSIPDWIGFRVGSLQVLDLRSCGISGAIPASLGNLSRVKKLHLSNNSLTGNIDPLLGQLQSLSVLDLSENFLTGSIPEEFSSLTSLTSLSLASNFISGPIPPGLGTISGLQRLNLSDNSLTSTIPTQLGDLSNLISLDLSKNSISGPLPSSILMKLKKLKDIRIGENGLDGQLPQNLFSDLSQLPELQIFDLSGNNLTGNLPKIESDSNVTKAAVFNFSSNLLYGTLDASWLSGSIDLSGNYFQGLVRANADSLGKNCLQNLAHQRSLTDCRAFYTEIGLVFDDFGSNRSDERIRTDSGSRNKPWVYVVIGVCSALGVIVVLVLVVLLIRRCKGKDVGPAKAREILPGTPKDSPALVLPGAGDSFTYQQILQATSGFSDLSLIKRGHSGELYQGLLDNRAPVVVKKVAPDSSYVQELEFFGRVSHTRLVPLLGHCLGGDNEKFLVYKYMPNGDVASSFYRPGENEDDSLRSIDWITRLKIAIGAAEGLVYLHHECSPPIVHRDIQASSILLDDKFEVRLGSLSETRTSEGEPHHSGIKRFLRKPGTSDQGSFGLSSATCAYDVYCFGKVLLELVTGKIGIGKLDDTAVKEWIEHSLPYISVYDKELVTKIMDPSLIVDEDLLEEVWAMAIVARSCLNPKPSKRPLTKYILRALENPLKVVREDHGSSSRLRTNSSRRSWNAAFFGSWRHSLSDSTAGPSRQPGRVRSHSSSGNDHSSSHKRLSSEIFPEPISMSEL